MPNGFKVPEPHGRNDEFLRLWELYLDVRRAKRASNSVKTLDYVYDSFLRGLDVPSATALLKIAVDRSWVGLMWAVNEAQKLRLPLHPATSAPAPPPEPAKPTEPDNWRGLLAKAAYAEAAKRGLSRHGTLLEDLTYVCQYGEGDAKGLWSECERLMEEA